MFKKEMNYYENDLEFQWVYQGFKKYKVQIDIKIFNQGINNINSMFKSDVQ